jgi:aspartate kinase
MDLFDDENHDVFAAKIAGCRPRVFLSHNKSPNYNFVYDDQVVSYGELISTTILSHYMDYRGIQTQWLDVRNFIKTNSKLQRCRGKLGTNTAKHL